MIGHRHNEQTAGRNAHPNDHKEDQERGKDDDPPILGVISAESAACDEIVVNLAK
jgi:hypothetical protein